MRRRQNLCLLYLLAFFLFFLPFHVVSQHKTAQDDPVLAIDTPIPPRIDGKGEDSCWQKVQWQSIGQVWIPYGTKVDSNDYWGNYKVVWSSSTNLLYFLVDVTDNIFIDGYHPGTTPEIFNYDIIEVFIDEDKSGGLHVFDGKGEDGIQWGTNAENAFSYHIYAPFPEDGKITTTPIVDDIAGTNWSNAARADYTFHVPEFALRKTGQQAAWEFSLAVYNDTYSNTMTKKDSARSHLYDGKIIGLTLAYCDNDSPKKEPKVREKFYGSVPVPPAAYNDHWKNSDYFGRVKLVTKLTRAGSNFH
jgi:hypothetical protein